MKYLRIKARLIDETTEMFNHKESMTLRLGVKFEVGKIDIDPFDDFDFEEELEFPDMESFQNHLKNQKEKENKENKPSYIPDITPLIWSTKYKVCTKSNINTLIDEQYEERK